MSLEIFYDGECVFCQSYVRMIKLRKAAGQVELISVRDDDPRIQDVLAAGYNLNKGMVVRYQGKVYYGHRAMQVLNRLEKLVKDGDDKAGVISSFFYKITYPALVLGRMIVLFLLGSSLHDPQVSHQMQPTPYRKSYRSFRLAVIAFFLFFCASSMLVLIEAHLQTVFTAIEAQFGPLRVSGLDVTFERAQAFFQTKFRLSAFNIGVGIIGSFCVALLFFFKETLPRRLFDGISRAHVGSVLLYAVVGLLFINLFESIFLRRLLFAILCMPLSAMLLARVKDIYRHKKGGFLPAFLVALFALNLCIPGFYLPPFNGGIGGWVVKINPHVEYTQTAYQLVRDDGATMWYSHALFNPVTMNGRFARAVQDKISPQDFVTFMIAHYKRLWPDVLSKGRLPHQKYLGKYGYPPHTRYNTSYQYQDFPPDRIVSIDQVEEVKTHQGELVSRRVLSSTPFNGE